MMKAVNIYLNFAGNTEEAFNFYKSVFGGEFMGGVMRFRDFPPMEGMEDMPPLKEEEKDLVGHVALPLTERVTLMGTDITSNMPEKLIVGNNIQITLEADSAAEAESLFGEVIRGRQRCDAVERDVLGREIRRVRGQIRHTLADQLHRRQGSGVMSLALGTWKHVWSGLTHPGDHDPSPDPMLERCPNRYR
ncbi:hypothetical protein [Nitrosospira sp. Is2]|uniref:hypothetical protein n=1 Tax=Nitrosospira sp. Is2 TaxID=3080532 RepID=UPI00295564F9|nr:hypothetical protein [Nitrosospira sp. Is2]WON74132.1 hypothetical protein R5L00_01190 [Nitrosospira sp. Is2]